MAQVSVIQLAIRREKSKTSVRAGRIASWSGCPHGRRSRKAQIPSRQCLPSTSRAIFCYRSKWAFPDLRFRTLGTVYQSEGTDNTSSRTPLFERNERSNHYPGFRTDAPLTQLSLAAIKSLPTRAKTHFGCRESQQIESLALPGES